MSRQRAAVAASLFLAFSLPVFAQLGSSDQTRRSPRQNTPDGFDQPDGTDFARSARLTGVVQDRESHPMDNARVELRHPVTGVTLTSTYTRPDGSFELVGLQTRTYELVASSGVSEIRQELEVTPGELNVIVHLPVLAADYRGPATVSVSEMQVPGKARNEVQKAEQNLQKKPADARKELAKALEIAPKYGKAHMLLGLLNLMQRRIREATGELEAAIQCDPGNARAFVALASAYNTEERYPDAIRALDSGTRLDPTAWQVYFETARAKLGMRDFPAALEQATKAEQLCPQESADIHLVKANALLGLRDYPRATDELERFLRNSPQGPQAEEVRHTLDKMKAFDSARK